MSDTTQYLVEPGGKLTGSIRVPGDKSVSHRSVIMGSLAQGQTTVSGFLEGEDSLRTLDAFKSMGVPIQYTPGSISESGQSLGGRLTIQGVGLNGLKQPETPLDLGNSGTGMRLISGVMAAQPFSSTLVGDSSLQARPMGRIIKPLTEMGADIAGNAEGKPPLNFGQGSVASVSAGNWQNLAAIHYKTPVASAQIKSCLLFAALYAKGTTEIVEPGITRDHTERMLRGFGVEIDTSDNAVRLTGGQTLTGCDIEVPADISSAAFFLVGASIAPGSDLTLKHVGVNPTRTGVIDILRLMGADLTLSNERVVGGEPVADIRVRYSELRGIDVPAELVPLAIDEFPAIFVAASCASGTTRISGAAELRVKETDRILAMANGLLTLGVNFEETEDGAVIEGGSSLGGGRVNSYGDHRIAMALAIAGLRASAPIEIEDCDNVNTSFPGFATLAQATGLTIDVSSGVVA